MTKFKCRIQHTKIGHNTYMRLLKNEMKNQLKRVTSFTQMSLIKTKLSGKNSSNATNCTWHSLIGGSYATLRWMEQSSQKWCKEKKTLHNNNRHNIAFTDQKKAGSLKCYICHSKESWQDCESKQRLEECPPQGNEVCATLQMTEWLRINGTQRLQTTYSKHCDTTEVCSLEECKRLGWLCSTNCCNQDSCNSSVTMVSNMICVIIFSFLCIL